MSTPATQPAAPAAPELGQLIARYSDAWAARDADLIASFHAEDGVFQLHSGGEPVRGREAIRDAFAGFLAQLPDLTFTEQELLPAPWGWTVRWTMSGTLAQPFPVGPDRVAEPGGSFAIDAVDVITVSGGRLDAKHTYLDWAAALDQLGLA
ncbi:MAG: nuclear transport factor 2 family protein [Solirubrobacterales bacterium]